MCNETPSPKITGVGERMIKAQRSIKEGLTLKRKPNQDESQSVEKYRKPKRAKSSVSKNLPSVSKNLCKTFQDNQSYEDLSKSDQSAEKSCKPKPKRAKSSVSKAEPSVSEFFQEKRNYEDLWQSAFPVGTEWDQLDSVHHQYKWDFSNLENAFEEDGLLYGKKVYLFGCTEPQFFDKVILVPAVVAVVSPFPPSDKIGIKSVQREKEEIVPMKKMKMDWVPYIPWKDREGQVDMFRVKSPNVFVLTCTQRRAALEHLELERVKKYEYCLPYFYDPFNEEEEDSVLQIVFPADPDPPILCQFDWQNDRLGDLVEDEGVPEEKKDAFKDFVKEKVREAKKANEDAREARNKALEEMTDEVKTGYANIKFYKFYPLKSPDTPELSGVKSSYINRYYGHAHEIL